jgi:hypothetical protein
MHNEQNKSNLTPIRLAAGESPAQHREMLASFRAASTGPTPLPRISSCAGNPV